MEFLPAYEFRKCVEKYRGEYKVKNFSCMDQFLTMAFAQLTYRESLRDTVTCLEAAETKLYHMGIRSKPTRNNLSNANAARDWRIYQEFALILAEKVIRSHGGEALSSDCELKEAVFALDSTTIDICLSLFPWAKFRKRKGAVKLHTLLDVRSSMPQVIYITDGKTHDVRILDRIPLLAGAFYVMDRGYLDFGRLHRFCGAMAFYVTRAKRNFKYKVLESFPVDKGAGVLADQKIELTGYAVRRKYSAHLRRISFVDLETRKRFVFLTNNFQLPAAVIAFLYRCRWRIECFFRWVKQNLRIKSFFGTSPNAVKTQIWIAIAVYALVSLAKTQLRLTQSPYVILQVLSIVIFEKQPVTQIFTDINHKKGKSDLYNQLVLFN
jgi:hypothetical protein